MPRMYVKDDFEGTGTIILDGKLKLSGHRVDPIVLDQLEREGLVVFYPSTDYGVARYAFKPGYRRELYGLSPFHQYVSSHNQYRVFVGPDGMPSRYEV